MSNFLWQQPADMPLGVAKLAKLAFDGVDLGPLRSQLLDKYIFEPDNAAALMDLSTIEQLLGNGPDGLARQSEALCIRQIYRSPCAVQNPALRLLALAAPGDVGNNAPLEFLLEGSEIELTTLYIVPGRPLPEPLPEHDIAIMASCESDANRAVLDEVARLVPAWPKPVLNHPGRIAALARERLHGLISSVPGIVMPATRRIDRESLDGIAVGTTALTAYFPGCRFPLLARPIDSHAGRGLEKLDDPTGLARYLAVRPERGFHISPYIDYRSPDGLFRKYRIVFVGGRPYPCHMATGEQWMLYYLNAGMAESAAKRSEEDQFMTGFDGEFAQRHSAALTGIVARVGLDYFGIDCAETGDGRLLLFEADVAMIVHLMDSPVVFPYKIAPMRRLFADFGAMLKTRAARPPATRRASAA